MSGALRDARTQRVLVPRLAVARSWWQRIVGLMGRSSIADDEALWFDRCDAVHTLGMRVPIDVVFLSRDREVLSVVPNVPTWRPWIGVRGASSVIELAAGNATRTGIVSGTQLELQWDSPTR